MTELTGPRIITPQEAQEMVLRKNRVPMEIAATNLAHTVATEPERTRSAVVKALRDLADAMPYSLERQQILGRADDIENGADW